MLLKTTNLHIILNSKIQTKFKYRLFNLHLNSPCYYILDTKKMLRGIEIRKYHKDSSFCLYFTRCLFFPLTFTFPKILWQDRSKILNIYRVLLDRNFPSNLNRSSWKRKHWSLSLLLRIQPYPFIHCIIITYLIFLFPTTIYKDLTTIQQRVWNSKEWVMT